MPKDTNPHKDHRERVRKEFLQNGFSDATPPHKILEMLLFYAIPRKDTNEIAHALLNKFKTLDAVLEATPYELMQVKGIGENAAALIKLILPLCRSYTNTKADIGFKPNSIDDIIQYLQRKYVGFSTEVFAVTTFNGNGTIIAFDIINRGDVASVGISVRDVVSKALERKAIAVVISHNHPNGTAVPSAYDIESTRRIATALKHIGIELIDHIVFNNDDCVSFAQSEKLHYALISQ